MSSPRPETIEEAEVVLHLEVDVVGENHAAFIDFCRRAFPIYESLGGNRMVLYEDKKNSNRFNEIAYYRTEADFQRGEYAVVHDPVQSALIKEWRSLLKGPPKVTTWLLRKP